MPLINLIFETKIDSSEDWVPFFQTQIEFPRGRHFLRCRTPSSQQIIPMSEGERINLESALKRAAELERIGEIQRQQIEKVQTAYTSVSGELDYLKFQNRMSVEERVTNYRLGVQQAAWQVLKATEYRPRVIPPAPKFEKKIDASDRFKLIEME